MKHCCFKYYVFLEYFYLKKRHNAASHFTFAKGKTLYNIGGR